mmetsp:Transcript_5926/g.9144  ORF Transcript_5926/g.9144 Transcript_5926/m.9144 type:complete len:153 (-) Transcript_5926:134-592(-)
MGQACSSGCSDGKTSNNNYDIFEEIANGDVQKTVTFDKKFSHEMDFMLAAPLTSFDTEETATSLSDLDIDVTSPVAIAPEKSAAIVATTLTQEEKGTITTTTITNAKNQKRKTQKISSKKKKSGKQGRRGNKHKSKKQKAAGRKTYADALLG